MDEARALITRHNIDVNADRFGMYQSEPLLHAVARCGWYDAYLMLRTVGADPNKRNSRGKTALYIALDNKTGFSIFQFKLKEIRSLFNEDPKLGLATSEELIWDYMRDGRARDVQNLICDGVLSFKSGLKLTHVAVKNNDLVAVQVVAVWFDLDFKERDADGKTALECAYTPEMRELLIDAGADMRERDLAIMMAFHSRLGADSPIQSLEMGVVLAMVLPYTSRVEDISEVRESRLKALTEEEGIVVTRKLRDDYVNNCAMFVPARFRLKHFLRTSGIKVLSRLVTSYTQTDARAMIKRRLAWRGFLFTEPFTPDYEERAKEAIEHPLPDEDDYDDDDDDDYDDDDDE